MTPTPREILKDYVRSGKLMQLATLQADGSPEVCNVWYDAHFNPDVLLFISRSDRNHSSNLRANKRVAGSIVAIRLEGLGQPVRGVTFKGTARELPVVGIDAAIGSFVKRWPASAEAVDPDRLANGTTPTRLYEVAVDEWVLFDEAYFGDQPRQVIRANQDPLSSDR